MTERYRVVRELEVGGMAQILEAYVRGDAGFERRVAIKRLHEHYVGDASVENAFFDEARIVSQLTHPNIVQIFDYGMIDDRPFLALELVDGANLHDLVERTQQAGVDVPPEVALHVTLEIARALEYAHGATDDAGQKMNIVHRDVTPRNVLVSKNGDVKLTDFGVALANARLEQTAAGQTKGTLTYMAPEQASGGNVDARTDIFSLGLVLHFAMVGRSPIEDVEQRMRVYAGGRVELDAKLPDRIRRLVERATRFSMDDRYPNARALSDECWAALTERTNHDARRMLADWVGRFAEEKKEKPRHAVGDLFDFALLENKSEPGRRRFTSVARSPLGIADVKATVEVIRDHDETVIGVDMPRGDLVTDDLVTNKTARPRAPDDDFDRTITKSSPGGSGQKDPRIGTSIYGYRITERLTNREWWTSYIARHEIRDVDYELVVFEPSMVRPDGFDRLRSAAQTIARLGSPAIQAALECDKTPDGAPFLIRERRPGPTLEDLIEVEAPLPRPRATAIVHEIAEALTALHAAGASHGLLTPASIRVEHTDAGDHVTLLDVGVAQAIEPDAREAATDVTYHAPEQLDGRLDTAASDLYALGVIMYELVEGRPPFAGDRETVVGHHRRTMPRPLSDTGIYTSVVDALLEKDPDTRALMSAERIAVQLQPAVLDSTTRVLGIDPLPTDPTAVTGRPRLGVGMIASAIGLGVAIAALFAVVLLSREPPARIQPTNVTANQTATPAATRRPNAQPAPTPPPTAEPPPVVEPAPPPVKRRRASPKSTIAEDPPPPAPAPPPAVDRQTVTRDLAKVASSLEKLTDNVPATELERLESRYFDLRLALKPDMSPDELARLSKRIARLAKDIAKAKG